MATKPTVSDAEFASDALFLSGAESGLAVRADPGAGTRKQGFIAEMTLIPQWVNFTLYQFYLWCVYVNDLHNSAGFLSQNYHWTGTHQWDVELLGASFSATSNNGFKYSTPPSRTLMVPLTSFQASTTGNWAFQTNVGGGLYRWTVSNPSSGTSGVIVCELSIPTGCVVTGVRADRK